MNATHNRLQARLLITGSRDWRDEQSIAAHLDLAWRQLGEPEHMTLISGACPTGADRIAESVAELRGWNIERHPADWAALGKRAGFLRNAEMVQSDADLCIAFIRDSSRGASMTIELAQKAGLTTWIVRNTDGVSPEVLPTRLPGRAL